VSFRLFNGQENGKERMNMNPQKIELHPIKDAYVCDCKPNETNPNGNEKVLYQGQYKKCFDRILSQWDLSTIKKEAKIIKAEMHFFHEKLYASGKKTGHLVYYPLAQSWDDKTVTLNTLPEYYAELKIVADWPEEKGWHIVDITEIVKKWIDGSLPNYGMYCHSEGTESTFVSRFISNEGTPIKSRPKLVVEHEQI
jgi:hypothetical protein